MNFTDQWISFIHQLQDDICNALENADGDAKFIEDAWERAEGGGGKTRVISNGQLIEKGGVNSSVVYGKVTGPMQSQLKIEGDSWFACGLSLVLHPLNPFVPTVHCNYRMFELYNAENLLIDRWFGGGTDLTPYYLFEEDAKHFHQTCKTACDKHNPEFYTKFKKQCDEYFWNAQRDEAREERAHSTDEAAHEDGLHHVFVMQRREQRLDHRSSSLSARCSTTFSRPSR